MGKDLASPIEVSFSLDGPKVIAISFATDEESKALAEAIGAAKLLDRIGPSEKPSYQQLKGLTLPIEVNSRVRDCNRREEEARGTEGQERSAFRAVFEASYGYSASLASVRNQDYRRSASGRYQANETEDKQPELSPVQMTLRCPVDSEVKSHSQNVSLGILRV